MEYSLNGEVHTLSCDSYGTPPTQVIWEKDGKVIQFNDSAYRNYHFSQTLTNRTASAYSNVLTITASIEDVVGDYACTVVNSLGRSDKVTRSVRCKCTLVLAKLLIVLEALKKMYVKFGESQLYYHHYKG